MSPKPSEDGMWGQAYEGIAGVLSRIIKWEQGKLGASKIDQYHFFLMMPHKSAGHVCNPFIKIQETSESKLTVDFHDFQEKLCI